MGMIPIDDLTPGMVLAADVHDRSGRLLLGSDAELTAKHIHVFRTWGIIEVKIAGIEEDAGGPVFPAEVSPEQVKEAEAVITKRFKHADLTNPAVKELYNLCVQQKVHYVGN